MDWRAILDQLERGEVRCASPMINGEWQVHPEMKQAILEAFKAGQLTSYSTPHFVDKDTIPPQEFSPQRGIRVVPGGTSVRRGSYLAPGVIVMPPSYINIGAYVDSGTMVDSHVLVGSCAQIGKKVHLSAGVQIGGVLEPIGERPVIIEDEVFVGAGVIIVEGIHVKRRAVIAPGVVLSKSVPIYDLINERMLTKGESIPEGAVIVPGSRPIKSSWGKEENLQIHCALIIKYRDGQTEQSLILEDLLR